MPCSMTEIEVDRTKENLELKRIGDGITHALDMLRESIIAKSEYPVFSSSVVKWSEALARISLLRDFERSGPTTGTLTDEKLFVAVNKLFEEYNSIVLHYGNGKCASIMSLLKKKQTEHRKEDLKRLALHFIETDNKEKVKAVLEADPKKPLKEQLGFDPDDY